MNHVSDFTYDILAHKSILKAFSNKSTLTTTSRRLSYTLLRCTIWAFVSNANLHLVVHDKVLIMLIHNDDYLQQLGVNLM